MVNANWFKIFIICLVIICLGFLSWQIVAMVETANSVKDYLKVAATCPNFSAFASDNVDHNYLTMKDSCTGLVWMSRPLPIYKTAGIEVQPGYVWQNAKNTCAGIAQVDGTSLFRLPTVEELLSLVKVSCDNASCTVNSDFFPADIDKTFANGYYWSANDFNEDASWATDNAGRDYKRSVNLLTGQVDSPVFGKDVQLNAWCVVARQPEIIERKFTSVTNQVISNGSQALGGSLRTVYNRKCAVATVDDDCSALSALAGTVACENNVAGDGNFYCVKTANINLTDIIVASCDPNYHVAADVCQLNPPSDNCGNSYIDLTPLPAELCDDGATLNGKPGQCNGTCSGCGLGYRIDSAKCVSNCGNGTVDLKPDNSLEICDNGALNGQTGKCNSTCTGCDAGYYNVNNVCTPNCGNGDIDLTPLPAELCDDGPDNGQPDKCNSTCNGCGTGFYLNSTTNECNYNCGNGTFEDPELCDDGVDNGQPGKCNTACTGCATGYHLEGKYCIADVIVYQCVGTLANATICPEPNATGLIADTNIELVTACADAVEKCEYTCNPDYIAFNNTCIELKCGDGVVTPGSPEICDDGDPLTGGKNGVFGYCNSTCTGIQGFGSPFFYDNFELPLTGWMQGYCPTGSVNCSWSRVIHPLGSTNYSLESIGGSDSSLYPRDYWVDRAGLNEKVDVDVLVMIDFPPAVGLKDAMLIARRSGSGTTENYYGLLTNNGSASDDPNILVRYKNGSQSILVTGPDVNITGRNWLRLQVYNDSATGNVVIRSKWWPEGQLMPTAWEMTYTDTDTTNNITTGGNVGLAGWKTNTLYFDNFQAYDYVP